MPNKFTYYAARALIGVAMVLSLAACATAPSSDDPEAMAAYREANDPIEPVNRAIFGFNQGVDKAVIKPVAKVYRGVLPQAVRDSVRNFLRNLQTPVIMANEFLQGNPDRAMETFGRFAANTMWGVGGLFDVVPDKPHHTEDLGQTLAVWGVGEGPYLVLPIIGPSSARHTVGRVGDYFMDPINYWATHEGHDWIPITRTAVGGIDARSRAIETLDEIERTSIDFYAAIRSLYRQRRADLIRNGAPAEESPLPDISSDFEDDDGKVRISALEHG